MSVKTFIPQVWSARLLAHLDKAHIYGGLVNRDYEGDIKECGDTVKINQIGKITISDYTRNTDMVAPQELTTNELMLVINQSKSFNFQVDDVDQAQLKTGIIESAMKQSAYALADETDKFIAKTIKDDTTVPTLEVTGNITKDNVYQFLIDCKTQLDNENVPREGRFLVVPSEVEGLLLQDPRLVNGQGLAEEMKIRGFVGKMLGFNIYTSNNVPFNANKYTIIGGNSTGLTFAEQIIKTEAYRLEKRFSDGIKGLNVYGAKVVQPNALFKCDIGIATSLAKKKSS